MYGEAVSYDTGMTLLQKTHGYTTGEEMKKEHASQVSLADLWILSLEGGTRCYDGSQNRS